MIVSTLRTRLQNRRLQLFGLFITLSCIWAGLIFFRPEPPPIPLPADLERLDPQLQAHIQKTAEWIRQAPKDADRYETLGLAYCVNGLWAEARRTLEIAKTLDPNEPLTLLYLGVASQELGEDERALEHYKTATSRFPDFPQAYYRLGELLLRQGKYEEAEGAFQKLIELAPSEWRGYVGLGQVKLHQKELDSAEELLLKAIQINPRVKIAHHVLGLVYRGLGKKEAAQRELSLGMDSKHYPMPDPWSAVADRHTKVLRDQFELAEEYGLSGQAQKAVEILEAARVFHPDNPSLMNNLAVACLRGGQFERARDLAARVVELDGNNLSAHVTLTACYLSMNQPDAAMRHAERAIALSPSSAHGYLAKANVLLALEKDSEALDALKSAIQFDPANAQLRLNAGDICQWNLSRSEEAIDHYRQALEQNPAMMEAHGRLADLYTQLGREEEAAKHIEFLNQTAPANQNSAAP